MPLPTSHVFIVPSSPTSGHRTLKLVGLIQWEHATTFPGDPGILKGLGHNRIDVAGSLYPCAGIYTVVEATGTIRGNDRVSLI